MTVETEGATRPKPELCEVLAGDLLLEALYQESERLYGERSDAYVLGWFRSFANWAIAGCDPETGFGLGLPTVLK